MAKVSRRFIFLGLGLLVLGALLFIPGLILWQMHRLTQMCEALRPGTPVAAIWPTVKSYGLWNSLVAYEFEHPWPPSINGQEKTWQISIPAPSTLGDMECLIWHNQSVVLGAKVVGP